MFIFCKIRYILNIHIENKFLVFSSINEINGPPWSCLFLCYQSNGNHDNYLWRDYFKANLIFRPSHLLISLKCPWSYHVVSTLFWRITVTCGIICLIWLLIASKKKSYLLLYVTSDVIFWLCKCSLILKGINYTDQPKSKGNYFRMPYYVFHANYILSWIEAEFLKWNLKWWRSL